MAEFSAFYTEWAERSGNDSMMPIVPWQDLSQDHARHSDRHSFVRKVWWVHMRPGSTVSRTRVTKKKKTNSQFRVVCQCIALPLYYTHHTSFTTSKHIGKYQYIYIHTWLHKDQPPWHTQKQNQQVDLDLLCTAAACSWAKATSTIFLRMPGRWFRSTKYPAWNIWPGLLDCGSRSYVRFKKSEQL